MGEIDRRQQLMQDLEQLKQLRGTIQFTPEQEQLIQAIEKKTQSLGLSSAPPQQAPAPQQLPIPPSALERPQAAPVATAPSPEPADQQLNVPRTADGREITTAEEAIQPSFDPFTFAATIPVMGALQGARKAADVALPRILKAAQSFLTSPTLNAAQVQDAASRVGGAGATVGEIGGQLAATALPAGPRMLYPAARVGLGALGAGAGYAAEQALSGQKVDPVGAATEAAFAGAGGAAEEAVRGATNFIARHSAGGRRLREDVLADRLRKSSKEIINPPGKEYTQEAYNKFYETGLPIFMDYPTGDSAAREFLNDLSADEMKLLRRTLRKWPAPRETTKGMASKESPGLLILDAIMGNPTEGGDVSFVNVENMDRFRQFLNKQARSTRDTLLGPVLDDFRGHVDDLQTLSINDPRSAAFLSQKGMQPSDVSNLIKGARDAHAANLAADAFDDLTHGRSITGYGDDDTGTFRNLHLGHLREAMEDPASVGAENAVERISRIPGAIDAYKKLFEDLQKEFQWVQVFAPTSRGKSPQSKEPVGRLFGYALATDKGRRLLQKGITEGRGRLAYNHLAMIANLSKREGLMGEEWAVGERYPDTNFDTTVGNEPGRNFATGQNIPLPASEQKSNIPLEQRYQMQRQQQLARDREIIMRRRQEREQKR